MKDINELVTLWQEEKISSYELLLNSEYKEEYLQFCNNRNLNEQYSADIFLDYKDEEMMRSQKIIDSWQD